MDNTNERIAMAPLPTAGELKHRRNGRPSYIKVAAPSVLLRRRDEPRTHRRVRCERYFGGAASKWLRARK